MSTSAAEAGAVPARKVDQLLAHYGESHRNPRNERIHFVAIPLIMLSLIGLLYELHEWVAYVFLGASLLYYAWLASPVFMASMAATSALALALVSAMGEQRLAVCVGLFVAAWIAQFIGHRMEGKKPSFFEDIQYLWVGPLFVLSKLFGRLGIRW